MALFKNTKLLQDAPTHYCPGCSHGVAHRITAEAIEELNMGGDTIGVAPVGCAVFAYNYFNCDFIQAAHGRAPAVATGVKRVHPDKLVFTYQGDGDLASIGLAETVASAARGENITVVFINNGIYGMTGGQMAPTSLIGQKSTTSVGGRDPKTAGYPIKVCEMLSALDGPAFLTRVSLHDPANVLKAKAAVKKGFQNQIDKKGFSLIEILGSCPTNWGLSPAAALAYVKNTVIPYYALGVFKDKVEV